MYLQNQKESRYQAADYWNFLSQMNSIDWWKKDFWLEVPSKQIVDWGLTRFSHCNNKRLTLHVIDSRNLKAISFLKMYMDIVFICKYWQLLVRKNCVQSMIDLFEEWVALLCFKYINVSVINFLEFSLGISLLGQLNYFVSIEYLMMYSFIIIT